MSFSSVQVHEENAKAHIKSAEKAVETSVFRFKLRPDFYTAATEMTEAAQCYHMAKNLEESRRCYVKAAEYRLKENDHLSAARCFEQGNAYDRAADCYVLNGGIEQAVRALMKKAATAPDSATQFQCYEKSLELYSQDQTDFKGVLASDVYKQYLPKLVAEGQWAKYFEVSKRYRDNLVQLEQTPFAHRELLGNVVVNLAAKKDLVGAERVLTNSDNLSVPGFVHSQEFAIADDLINALRENDEALLKKSLAKGPVTYLNVELAKLAKSLKTTPPPAAAAPPEVLDTLLM